MLVLGLMVGAILCAFLALRAKRLLVSALWLAGLSLLVALILYDLGAYEIAVVELSVGAGLVTVLFVFAINLAGDDGASDHAPVPRWLAWGLALGSVLLLGGLTFPWLETISPTTTTSFAQLLWQDRRLDLLVQVALIFSGALGVLGLLADDVREINL